MHTKQRDLKLRFIHLVNYLRNYKIVLDIYDFVSIFDDSSHTQAFTHGSIQNKALGINDDALFDNTSDYGSKERSTMNKEGITPNYTVD